METPPTEARSSTVTARNRPQWAAYLTAATASLLRLAFRKGFSTERKVQAGFVFALACLGLIGAISFSSVTRLSEEADRTRRTEAVIAALHQMLSTATDAETAERGYIITGDESFLEPYAAARLQIDAEFADLRKLTVDNPGQQRQLDVLEPLVGERIDVTKRNVELRRTQGFAAAQSAVGSGLGKTLHDRIRAVIAGMEAKEQSMLKKSERSAQHAATIARMIITGGSALALTIVVVAIYLVRRDFAGSRRAEAELRAVNDQLEARVRARTMELARSHESVQKSEARMAGIVGSAMDAIISVDRGQRVLLFNPAAEALFRCRASEAIGRTLDRFIPQPFREMQREEGVGIGRRGVKSWSLRVRGPLSAVRADGEEFPIEASISQIEVAGEKVYTVILRDITERKRAEQELYDSRHMLQLVLDTIPARVFWKDRDSRFLGCNKALATDALLSDPSEIIGKSDLDFSWRDTADAFRADDLLVMEGGKELINYEEPQTQADGRVLWLRTNKIPLRDRDNKIFGVFGAYEDITERRLGEEALRRKEEQLREAQRIAQVGSWEWNTASDCHIWSPETYRIYGRDPALGPADLGTVPGYFTSESWARLSAAVEEGLRSGASYECDAEVVRSDGSHRWITARGEVVRDIDGKIAGLRGTVQDITERKRAEEEIQKLNAELERRVIERTAQLEVANKELEAFSYSVSHDLRAPLRAMDGFSRAVVDDYGEQLPADGQRYLQIIRNEARRMGQLIDDLLTFSRLSRMPLNQRTVEMASLVKEALDDLGSQREGRQIEVRIGELPSCPGDAALVKQVWINLLSNAFKYTLKRQVAVVEIGCTPQECGNVYFVRDNGTGFDMRYVDKLFAVFSRLHRAEEYEGTGVGLAIVQRVIHRHGGRVWAEAAVDRGATFYFTLEGKANL